MIRGAQKNSKHKKNKALKKKINENDKGSLYLAPIH